MKSCSIAPFLEGCDSNNDHRITMEEWGLCLGLEDGDLQGKCDELVAATKEGASKSNEV
jgi:secreted protein acidic and rich in cysteine